MIKELSKIVGATGTLDTNGLGVQVRILEVKTAYGRVRYVVTPIAGTGSATVEDFRVTDIETDNSHWIDCPNHDGNYDCTPFCSVCLGNQGYDPNER